MYPYTYLLLVILTGFCTFTECVTTSSSPTSFTTPSPFNLRLVDGATNSSGRVEVFHDGQWGTVCDDGWGSNDALVVCRMLGYSNAFYFGSAYFGAGSGPIWMDNVACDGSEQNLQDCTFNGWEIEDCSHSEDAGVICFSENQEDEVAFRLSGAPEPNAGRVEVFYAGYWGTVCDYYNWDYRDATVTCKMLGFSNAFYVGSAYFGAGSGPIWMDNVACDGSEQNLQDCTFNGWEIEDCSHIEDAGVICFSENQEDEVAFRLSGAPEPNAGRVEVFYAGYWGTVCDYYNWDYRDATVTCKMLGFSDGRAPYRTYDYGSTTYIKWMGNVNCNGTESSLEECPFDGWGYVNSCPYPANVFCYNTSESDIDVRLTGGSGSHVGRVEVYYGGYWGTICGYYDWDYRDANVTCRMLGYSTGRQIYRTVKYGSLTEPVWMGGVDCIGTEDSLADCSFDGWGQVGYCSSYPATVFCYNITESVIDVRLTGGSGPHVGRVEVYYGGYWGTICGYYDWDYRDANVTCRMLGYSTGRQIYRTVKYGSLTEPVWMGGVDCIGTEDSLADCSFDGWGQVGYCSSYPASVFCYNITVNSTVDIRLVDGPNNYTGRLEVYYGGHWGGVCSQNNNLDDKDAAVVCRMLKYSDGQALYRTYGLPDEPIWMDNLRCNGTESSLADCPFNGWGQVGFCYYQARVACYNASAKSEIAVRLMGGSDAHVGRVEVFYGGLWGTVCDDYSWDYKNADVTCRMIGYSNGRAIYRTSKYGGASSPIWMDDVRCNGTEGNLADCTFSGWSSSENCNYPASVFCYNVSVNSSLGIRLVDRPNNYSGRVEVYYGGHWGGVCTYNYIFDGNDATVACRMLGYSDGQSLYRSYGLPDEPIWMENLGCNGTESSLADCPFDGWGQIGRCYYQARVACYNASAKSEIAVRLVGGSDAHVGRVEVFYGGLWGTVCDDYSWDYKNADVTCRMIGYSNGRAIYTTSKYGGASSPIWMDDVRCNGTEGHLADCTFSGWSNSDSCNYPASVFCYNVSVSSYLEVRMVDGPNNYTGRLEVYHGGHWGGVCTYNYGFDDNDATVACRMLGYSDGQSLYKSFGLPDEPIWMENLGCNGTESSLADCPFNGWGQVGYCYYQARVACYNASATSEIAVRLMGGSYAHVGRVEVFYGGLWGTVCDDYSWDYKNADVTCRMIGYSNGRAIYRTSNYGSATSPIWMDDVRCNGTEGNLAGCTFSGWSYSESCYYPASVFCYNVSAGSDIDVRLTGGSGSHVGRVEVYYGGYWGTICGYYDWDYTDARVTCRMMGYSTGHQIYRTTNYGSLTEPVWMGGVDCNGTEDSLADCSFGGWGQVGYCSSYPASVFCYNVTASSDIVVRLVGGAIPNVGRIEIYFDGMWGTVCYDYNWDNKNADVTCRMLGYSNGRSIYRTSTYGSYTSPVWMDDVRCNGTEENLADCSFSGWAFSDYCSYPASVFCYNVSGSDIDVRLTGGSGPHVGRVEVYYGGYWGTVCGYYDWDHRDANVTCKMLGYSNGRQIYRTLNYGYLTEPVWMGGVDCNGTEDSLADCSFDGWGQVGYCTDIDVRLTGGSGPHVGRVEVYYGGYWGTVCGYYDWDYRDANVTCRMMGYSNGRQMYRSTRYGILTEPIWMGGVDCIGTEDSLADCSFDGWGQVGYCSSYPAIVFCYNVTENLALDIRLVDRPNDYTGRVEVYYGGHWGGICTYNYAFDDNDANVACRMLGYSAGEAVSSVVGLPDEPVWMDNLRCDGTESSLADCPFNGWGQVGYCYYQARVACINFTGNTKDVKRISSPN
ncbi:deleted in malignant brain tumors 1 protein-like [Pecten maximus]|uniref:deleted in malignant brain tumors 1 protein-like n=1 Tax=Pecten maximus TaxID=6579 RepID=UPI0014588FEF|nr:deleted in malignant brain tumors 1 protein-like [Pecten maximus]